MNGFWLPVLNSLSLYSYIHLVGSLDATAGLLQLLSRKSSFEEAIFWKSGYVCRSKECQVKEKKKTIVIKKIINLFWFETDKWLAEVVLFNSFQSLGFMFCHLMLFGFSCTGKVGLISNFLQHFRTS